MSATMEQPVFPLRVVFSDGSTIIVDDEEDAAMNLEWLDTDVNDNDPVEVFDHMGRRVRLKIEFLETQELGLLAEGGSD